MADDEPVLSLRSLSKSYGQNTVLRDISFDVHAGEVVALLGENGAGKSTLAKIIAGAHPRSGGEILLAGERINPASPRDAIEAGITFIPQELVYVPELTVAENIMLGRAPARFGFISPRQMLRQAKAEAEAVGFELPLRQRMGSIPLMQQQLVEILKAISRGPKVIVLDEPTAALEAEDSARLMTLTRTLAERGAALIYISHRLDEVFAHCDSIRVLREGHLVLSGRTADLERSQVIGAMLGRSVETRTPAPASTSDAPIAVEAHGWSRDRFPQLDEISVDIHEGEIVGLYGLRGAGAETFAESLAGLHPDATGTLEIRGLTADTRTPFRAKRSGISHLPAERKSQGLVPENTVIQAMSLPSLTLMSRFGWVSRRGERAHAKSIAARTLLRARSLSMRVADLSGGNQQKVLLGSRLTSTATLLVLQEPTRGVDIGARAEIHDLLRELAASGLPQLLVTSDIEEAVSVCDRLLIIRAGRIVHEISNPTTASQSEAIEHAAGGVN